MSIENVQTDAYVHRLVCEAYHGPCPRGLQCRHLDGNRQNNKPGNLMWSDKATNEADKQIHDSIPRGSRSYRTSLTDEMVLDARKRAAQGERVDLMAVEYGVGYPGLLGAVTGRRWAHLPGAVRLKRGGGVDRKTVRSDASQSAPDAKTDAASHSTKPQH